MYDQLRGDPFQGQHLSELEKKNVYSLREAIRHKNKNVVECLIKCGTQVNDNSLDMLYNSPLHLGVISRSLEIVKLLLDAGANVNQRNSIGDTPLILAAKIGNSLMIDLLLSYNVQNGENLYTGMKHLHVACMRNKTDVIERLLLSNGGENINDLVKGDFSRWAGFRPLHFAVHYECLETVKLLLKYGADITAQDANQMTPLHLAAFQQNEEIIDLVLEAHKCVFENPSDEKMLTHFHIACTRNNPSIVEHFLKLGIDVNLEATWPPYHRWKPIHFAVYYECPDVVKLLLETKTYLEPSLLHYLLKYPVTMGNREIFDLLLSMRNTKSIKGDFKYEGRQDPLFACIQNDSKNIQMHITAQPILDAPIWNGYTVAHLAAKCNSVNVMNFLLNERADFTVQDSEGKTPLHIAFEYRRTAMVDQIVQSLDGPMENSTDNTGLSIFHILCSTKRVETVAKFLSQGIDVNAQVGCESVLWAGFTPMHFAVRFLQKEIVIFLLKSGANISIRNMLNMNPLDLLVDKLNVPVCSLDKIETMFEIFLSIVSSRRKEIEKLNITAISPLHALCLCGKKDSETLNKYIISVHRDEINKTTDLPNSLKYNECTALHFCMQKGLLKSAKLLLDKGADPLMIDSNGRTPLECAKCCIGSNDFSDVESIFSLQTPIEIYKPIHFHLACLSGNTNVVRNLLNKAFDERLKMKLVNSFDNHGATPLHTVVRSVDNIISLKEITHLLLENGANVNARDIQLQTPLHLLDCYYDDLDVMRTLISYGADVDAQNLYGQTPLHLVFNIHLRNHNNDFYDYTVEQLKLLLENGADINIVDEQGCTRLDRKFIPHRYEDSNSESEKFEKEFFVILLKHVNRLRAIGFHISSANDDTYDDLLEEYSEIFDEADFIRKCQKELESMMSKTIDSRTTLHDIIFKSPNKMVSYSNNVVLQKLINSRELFEKFPIYGYLVALQFERGKNRGPLLTTCMRSFSVLSGRSLPSICLDTIFQYLSNIDLKSIALSVTSL